MGGDGRDLYSCQRAKCKRAKSSATIVLLEARDDSHRTIGLKVDNRNVLIAEVFRTGNRVIEDSCKFNLPFSLFQRSSAAGRPFLSGATEIYDECKLKYVRVYFDDSGKLLLSPATVPALLLDEPREVPEFVRDQGLLDYGFTDGERDRRCPDAFDRSYFRLKDGILRQGIQFCSEVGLDAGLWVRYDFAWKPISGGCDDLLPKEGTSIRELQTLPMGDVVDDRLTFLDRCRSHPKEHVHVKYRVEKGVLHRIGELRVPK